MRIFWTIVALVLALGVGIPLVSAARSRADAQRALAERAEAEARRAQLERKHAEAQPAAIQSSPVTPAPTIPAPVIVPPPAAAPADAPKTVVTEPVVIAQPTPTPQPPTVAPAPSAEAKPVEAKPVESKTDAAPPAPVPAKPAAAPSPAPTEKPAAAVAAAPAVKIIKKDDGSIVIDDKYTVKGDGTEAAPYQLSWELLTSIQESYDPRVGKKTIPERLAMFDNKYIQLTGYVAFPLFVEQPRELLSMLNQWDGCCIGVPPTPYDAVEVHLKDVVSKDQRLATFGTVQGKFQVKPYLAGDWLVGLYVLEDAKVAAKDAGGQGT